MFRVVQWPHMKQAVSSHFPMWAYGKPSRTSTCRDCWYCREMSRWDILWAPYLAGKVFLSDAVLMSFIHWPDTFGLKEHSQGDAKLQWKSDSIPSKAMFGLETRTREQSYKQSWPGIFQQNRSFVWHSWFTEIKLFVEMWGVQSEFTWLRQVLYTSASSPPLLPNEYLIADYKTKQHQHERNFPCSQNNLLLGCALETRETKDQVLL